MKYIITYRFYILTLCFFTGMTQSFSQNLNIEWSANSSIMTINSVDVTITSNLTKQGNSFVWEQRVNDITETNEFSIVSVTGNWDAQDALGTINYELSIDGIESNLQVNGNNDGITMTLLISSSSPTKDIYTFHIDTLTQL